MVKIVFMNALAAFDDGRIVQHSRRHRIAAVPHLVKALDISHEAAEKGESVMLNIIHVQSKADQIIWLFVLPLQSVAGDHPKYGGKDFMHALTITNVSVELAIYEEDLQEHALGFWLPKVGIFGHATLDVLEDLCPYLFILAQCVPW